ncbi:MAG TPA: TolC family protein [Gemmatimonadaceae bacterium]|nr:TolC family protein [Gemmatimonadaceae bacterium]
MPFFLLVLALQGVQQSASPPLQPTAIRDTIALSLPLAVERGLRLGDEARIAARQVDIADAQVTMARAAGLPQLRLNGSQSHVMQSARASAVGSIFNQPNTYTANATVSQTLFQGGRIVAASRAARHVRAAARLDRTETTAQVSLDIQRAYLEALFARNLADIQDTSLALASARLAQVREFLRAGRASRYDVLRAGVERANIEPVAIQARSNVELALIELKRLINIPFEQPVRLTTSIDTATVIRWIDRLLTDPAPVTRPAVRSAELVAEARHAGVRVAKADLFPSVSLTGLVGAQAFPRNGFPTARGRFETVPCPADSPPDRVCSAQNGGWFGDKSFGIQIGFPLFDGFRAKGAIDLASAQARLADLELAQTRESVASETAAARAELDRARAAFAARGQNAAEALEAFRLAELRQSRGLATQLEVADAQLALTVARTNEARAVYDLYLAAAAYARAIGRPPQAFDLSGAVGSTTPGTPNAQ